MQRHRRAIVLSIVLAMMSIAAGPPVALRVETAAVRPEGDATVISITIQAAPEDRARLGRDVWVQGELLRRGERVNRTARALDLDERGQAAFEVAWPPGDYELRVSIEAVSGKAAGVWVGRLVVPALTAAAPSPAASPVPPPAPAPAAAAPVAAVERTVMEPAPQPEAVAPTAAVPEPAPEVAPAEALPVAVAATAAAAVVIAEAAPSATEPAPQPEAPPARTVPEVAATPAPVEVPADADSATAAAAVVVAEAAPSATEPALRPEAGPVEAALEPAAEAPVAAAPPAAPAAAAGPWATAHPGLADLTVIVTERNRPILGLDRSAFRLRVDGSPATVEAVGDEDTAPLNLAIVADVAADAGELVDEVARQLGRFSLRTGDSGALLLATTTAPQPGWGASADDILGWADAAAAGRPDDLAGLVAAAARSFADRRGRSFLVVVTDGSDSSGKAAWKDAAAAVEATGVPVFVVGLRDSGFDDQARSALGRAAEDTGGRSYYLGAAGMAGMTLDYLGELIDASYALAYRTPAAGPGPRDAKVEVVNRDWQVHAPRRVP